MKLQQAQYFLFFIYLPERIKVPHIKCSLHGRRSHLQVSINMLPLLVHKVGMLVFVRAEKVAIVIFEHLENKRGMSSIVGVRFGP